MKLKPGFITYEVGDSYIAVATEAVGPAMNGMIRSNDTAAFIINQLMNETTEDQIVAAMLEKYDVSQDTALVDVHEIINQLKNGGLLED